MKRFVRLGTLGLLIAALAVYLADAIILQARLAHGTALRVIAVNQFLATPLKGQKVEYDLAGTVPVTCTRSLFPQRGYSACWWVERHTAQWQ